MFSKLNISKNKVIASILIIIMLYFSFLLLFAKYGFIKNTQVKQEVIYKDEAFIKIEAINSKLTSKINSFKNDNIDKDLLDEQVRKNLGYVDKDETIIYFDK